MMIDISQELFSCNIFPGDLPPVHELVKSIERDGYNLTNMSLCVHNGTHIDAPCHFVDSGKTIDKLDLSIFHGKCTVAEFDGVISGNEITDVLKNCNERLLLKGKCELSDEAAAAIANSHVRLIGVESQSVGNLEHPKSVHMILLEKEIIPLEGLNLSNAAAGEYILSAFPLNLGGADGSPVRAVLLEL